MMGGVLVPATREALFQLGMIPRKANQLETREAVSQSSQNRECDRRSLTFGMGPSIKELLEIDSAIPSDGRASRSLEHLGCYAIATMSGGVGWGSGEPLATSVVARGGVGCGRGEPLATSVIIRGGVGWGRGDPLAARKGELEVLLSRRSLTLLTTGSTIKTVRTSKARRIEIFFMMVELLLGPTMQNNQ